MKHVIRPAAKGDIVRQFRFYLQENAPEAATRFLDAVDESIEAICQMPHIGAPKSLANPVTAGLRSWAIKGFEDMLIFYVVQRGAVRVIRVLHAARDIGSILNRQNIPKEKQ